MSHNSNLLLTSGNFCKWRLKHFSKMLNTVNLKELTALIAAVTNIP